MNDMGKMDAGDSATHTLVIGAGFGGIAAALRMRAKGHRVTLVERLDAIGGRAQAFEQGGFRHDAGPTVITAPFLFDELFALFGEKREDYLDFRPLDPWYRFHFHDGSEFDYRPSLEDTHAEIARFSPEDTKVLLGNQSHWRKIDQTLCTFLTSNRMVNKHFDKLLSMCKKEHS
ncbi:MAG: FAD-dependent oxidoreductase, partial [Pseudomonadota bacterium]|nr:FAD-dependent oxidoreductase [Pseudomonadota bacterium]